MISSNILHSKRLLLPFDFSSLYTEGEIEDINFQNERRCPYVSEYIRANFKTVL